MQSMALEDLVDLIERDAEHQFEVSEEHEAERRALSLSRFQTETERLFDLVHES